MTDRRLALAGAVVGLVGALLLALFVAQSGRARAQEPTVDALIVTQPLSPGMGAEAVAGRVRTVDVPADLAPRNRIQRPADLADRQVVRAVGEGELLTAEQFAVPGPVAGGLVVPAGYEAVAVEADPAPGVEGYVTPGARVNVYAVLPTTGADGAPAQAATQLVLGHVTVLAVTKGTLTGEAQPVDGRAADPRIVLLLQLRPQDAPVLVHAQTQGQLWFSLVNADDPLPVSERVDADALAPHRRTQAIKESRP